MSRCVRVLVTVLALAILASAGPTVAFANRGAASARQPRSGRPAGQTKAAKEAKAKALQARTARIARSRRKHQKDEERPFLGGHLRVRPNVRRSAERARENARDGKMGAARSGLTQVDARNDLGLRERLTLWSARRAVERTPLRQQREHQRQQREHQLRRLRRTVKAAEARAERGELQRAADHLAGVRWSSLGRRERRAARRAESAVREQAFRQASRRSKRGDIEGTADALGALNTLQANGRLGWWNRGRAKRADAQSLRRNLAQVRRLVGKRSDPDGNEMPPEPVRALEQLRSVAGIWGADHPRVKQATRTLFHRSMKIARKAARQGDPHQAEAALQAAGAVAPHVKSRGFERQAERIMKTAAHRSAPRLVRMARTQQRMGDAEQAAQTLLYAQHLQRTLGVKPGWRTRRIQRRLEMELGPRLAELKRQMRQQGMTAPPAPEFQPPTNPMTAAAANP